MCHLPASDNHDLDRRAGIFILAARGKAVRLIKLCSKNEHKFDTTNTTTINKSK